MHLWVNRMQRTEPRRREADVWAFVARLAEGALARAEVDA
jgi:hypothetical protein